jgi:hypothetical protein
MTFLHFAKASLRIGPFWTWVVQSPCGAWSESWGSPIRLGRETLILTSSMHLSTFSSLKDFKMKKRVSGAC